MTGSSQGAAVRRNGLRHAVGTAVVVAVLLVIGGGSWLAWGRDLELAGARDARPVGEAGRVPADRLALADMGGVHENYQPIRTFGGVTKVGFLTDDEVVEYADADASGARMAVSIYPEGKATLAVVQVRDADAARDLAAELADLQEEYGLKPAETHVHRSRDGLLTRTVYTHEDLVVRLEVRGKTSRWVREKTAELVEAQREVLAADE
ncbi:hypothetical protein AB0A63_29605 [Lentzea sp. NPDC042327]|uniref:hypothetical protein n=1 Tax=Lentzea sp. NPDC042327 TaxID=3154801 RepID=UPI0033D7AA07